MSLTQSEVRQHRIPGGFALSSLLYVLGDGTVLVESQHADYEVARPTLAQFAQLVQRMDPIHVYRILPLSIWQAASIALSARDILTFLRRYSSQPLPLSVQQMIVKEAGKWGLVSLDRDALGRVVLQGDPKVIQELAADAEVQRMGAKYLHRAISVPITRRGDVKKRVSLLGYPVVDRAGYQLAQTASFSLKEDVKLREYQVDAVNRFLDASRDQSGVIVLPCGAGKTLVGIAIAAKVGFHTLILAPSESAALQWEGECKRFTTLRDDEVKRYRITDPLAPVTITTYQRVTAKTRDGQMRHLEKLTTHPWGLVIYDEVHMLPAPLFRLAAELQSVRRLGLTATLVREDGADVDVFSLIGPKRYEVAWKSLEHEGYLAAVKCVQVRVPLSDADRGRYDAGTAREKHRIAAQNPRKLTVAKHLVDTHRDADLLILGHYLEPLTEMARLLACPLVTGQTPQVDRDLWFESFRRKETRRLVLSRVANMAVNLPNASVAIQLSGLFGSRQEEAQRLGRLLRPASGPGIFYTLVSEDTVEEKMAFHRQMYLMEQGYSYVVTDFEAVME